MASAGLLGEFHRVAVNYRGKDKRFKHYDLWALPLDNRTPFPVARTKFDERDGQFSPDGKWIAYESDESGRFEI